MIVHPSRASTTVLAVDARTSDHAGAEHLVHLLDGVLPAAAADYVASTHLVAGAPAHTAVAASWSSAEAAMPAVDEVLGHLAAGLDGTRELAVVVLGEDGTVSRGPADLVEGALRAGAEHRSRSAGRLARYPGRADVERRCTVADVLALSAIDAVEALAGTTVEPRTALDLSEWARPTWQRGRAVLLVQAGRSALVPFESRHQIPCCSDH